MFTSFFKTLTITPFTHRFEFTKNSFRFLSARTMSGKRKSSSIPTSPSPGPKKKTPNGHWNQGLLSSLEDEALLVTSDDKVTVIKDKYPKAEFHYLVIPKEHIPTVKVLTRKHLLLLEHMEKVGLRIAEDAKHAGRAFKLGYHAEPSMSRLHLHVISDDMNSDCLKHKKHWNSFTTEFFVKSEALRENVEKNGKPVLPSGDTCKKYLASPLKCHKCNVTPKNIPELKRHILTHLK